MRNDVQGAASSVVAFLVAGVIFVGSVGALLVVSQDGSDVGNDSPAAAAALGLQSQLLADLVVASPGFHYEGNALEQDWTTATADNLGRLGLRENRSTLMDFAKFQNLRRAGYASTADGLVNYPDARASLGLDEVGLDFHLRAFPSLQSVRTLLANGDRDPNLRVAYIGDVEAVASGGGRTGLVDADVATPTCTPNGSTYTLATQVTNSGSTDTQMSVFFNLEFADGDDYEDRTRSYLVPSGSAAAFAIEVPYTAGRDCEVGVDLEVWDPDIKLWETGQGNESELTGGSATTVVTHDLWMNPDRTSYSPTQAITIEFDGDLPTKNAHGTVTLTLEVLDSLGTTVYGPTDIPVSKSVRTKSIGTLPAGEYVAELTYLGETATVRDPIFVTTDAPDLFEPASGTLTYEPTVPVPIEVGFLEDLVEKFCPMYYDSNSLTPMAVLDFNANAQSEPDDTYAGRCSFDRNANPHPGDVFPDTRDALNNDLPTRLLDPLNATYVQQCNGNIVGGPRYDWARVLVVGSNVDHNSMTSASAKYAVCEWVMGGGTLIVFGSEDQQVQWLQPIFHAAITSSSSAVSTPDASHPILNRADALGYDGYLSNGTRVWSFNGQTAAEQTDLLTNVVASASDSILSISNPGAFGDGTIILTTWLPYDLFGTGSGTQSEAEGLKVVNNFLMQGYRDLFLDYGPSIPSESRQAAAAQRVVDIQHPEFDDPITLTLFVYVF